MSSFKISQLSANFLLKRKEINIVFFINIKWLGTNLKRQPVPVSTSPPGNLTYLFLGNNELNTGFVMEIGHEYNGHPVHTESKVRFQKYVLLLYKSFLFLFNKLGKPKNNLYFVAQPLRPYPFFLRSPKKDLFCGFLTQNVSKLLGRIINKIMGGG